MGAESFKHDTPLAQDYRMENTKQGKNGAKECWG